MDVILVTNLNEQKNLYVYEENNKFFIIENDIITKKYIDIDEFLILERLKICKLTKKVKHKKNTFKKGETIFVSKTFDNDKYLFTYYNGKNIEFFPLKKESLEFIILKKEI